MAISCSGDRRLDMAKEEDVQVCFLTNGEWLSAHCMTFGTAKFPLNLAYICISKSKVRYAIPPEWFDSADA